MKKRSFAKAKNSRYKTRNLQKLIKYLKKLRAKRARTNIQEWHKTNAWDIS